MPSLEVEEDIQTTGFISLLGAEIQIKEVFLVYPAYA